MKPAGRSESSGLDAARRIVSRAERRALERAESLRAEAEQLLKLVAAQVVDAEGTVRAELDAEIRALRDEMAEASRRATVAENELELLRARADYPRTEVVSPSGGPPAGPDAERLTAAAFATAAQTRAQAELELIRAREKAVDMLAAASREAGELLSSAMAAIETNRVATESVRRQLEDERRAAADIRQELERTLVQATQEAARIREDGVATRDRLVDEATREWARVRDDARKESERILETALAMAERILADARSEATRFGPTTAPERDHPRDEIDVRAHRRDGAAGRDDASGLNTVRRHLLAEILALHEAIESARQSFGHVFEWAETEIDAARADQVVGSR